MVITTMRKAVQGALYNEGKAYSVVRRAADSNAKHNKGKACTTRLAHNTQWVGGWLSEWVGERTAGVSMGAGAVQV